MAPDPTTPDTPDASPPEPSLTARVVRGAAWVFAGKIVGRLLDLVKLVILARLLSPEDFGLFGIVMLAIAALETFSQTGFGEALIQRQGDIRPYLDTAWTIHVIRGFLLGALLFATAPLVGAFFAEPRAVSLLRVMSAAPVLGGLANIGMVYFQKELQFHKQVAYNLSVALVSATVGIVLAFHLRSVWALVWASLAGSVVRVMLSYLMHPWRPRPRLAGREAWALFRYGGWILAGTVLTFVAMRGDRAIVGVLLGATALGLYHLADTLGGMAATEILYLANAVMFPAYAKVQADERRLRSAFLATFEVVVSLCLPITLFLLLAASPIVLALFGQEWREAAAPLPVLVVAAFLRAAIGTTAPLFLATGRPRLQLWKSGIRACVTLGAVWPLTQLWGPTGAAFAALLGVVALLPTFAWALAIARIRVRDLVRRSAAGLALGAAVVVSFGLIHLAPSQSAAVQLTQYVLAAAGIGLALSLALARWGNWGPWVVAARCWPRGSGCNRPDQA